MKDYYGKTNGNKWVSNAAESIKQRLCLLATDARNLCSAASKRPLLVPAFLMLLCCFTCYYLSSCFPALVLAITVLVFFVFSSKRVSENKPAYTSVAVILCAVLVYIGLFISSKLNSYCDESDCIKCTVIRVSEDLSGELDLTVKMEDGALARANFNCKHGDIDPGDVLVIYGKIKEPDKAGNPGEFDYRETLRKQGVLYVISCNRYEVVGKAGFPFNLSGKIQSFFRTLRLQCFETVTGSFNETDKSLAAAVCIGDKSLISSGIKRVFKMSCCSHLLAVSGTHFAGFLACLPVVLNLLKVKRKNAIAVHALFCILIGCLTGWSDSVTRAAIMSICLFADREWLSALSLASIVMMLADPFCPLSTGFQLSFCAMIAIKIYGTRITDFLVNFHVGEKLSSVFSVTVSASLGLIPFWSEISMRPDCEHMLIQISGSFIAGAACTFFMPCVLLCRLLPFWGLYLSMPLKLCLEFLLSLVNKGCSLSEKGGRPVHLSGDLLLLLGITVFLLMIPPCVLKRLFFRPVALFLAVAIGLESFSVISKPNCRIVFADVGQGDCCLIMTPEKTCLIDAGTYEEGSSTVADLLDFYGIYQVDVCVMSHWDVDHAGGIAALCDQGRTKTILSAYIPLSDDRDKDVEEFLLSTAVSGSDNSLYLSQLQPVYAGDTLLLSESVYLEVLYPFECNGGGNEDSLVLMLHIGGEEETSILFTGDIGFASETALMDSDVDLDCDILKVAHHGSKYSTSEDFLEVCSPEAAVISVGAHNFYGHPSPDTLERLESYGCEVFRTDQEGAVMLEY